MDLPHLRCHRFRAAAQHTLHNTRRARRHANLQPHFGGLITETPSEPDWTRLCKVTDLDDLRGQPYMLRTSDDPTSPWRSVKIRNEGWWTDRDTGTHVYYVTVEFYNDDSERILNETDEIEVGLIRPPWWPEGAEPQKWPRGDDAE